MAASARAGAKKKPPTAVDQIRVPRWIVVPLMRWPWCTATVVFHCVCGVFHRPDYAVNPCVCLPVRTHPRTLCSPSTTHKQVANLQLKLHQLHATDVNTFRWDCTDPPCPNAWGCRAIVGNRVCLHMSRLRAVVPADSGIELRHRACLNRATTSSPAAAHLLLGCCVALRSAAPPRLCRRSYASIAQHVEALKLEASVSLSAVAHCTADCMSTGFYADCISSKFHAHELCSTRLV